MSDKLPMYDVGKIQWKVLMDVETAAKVDRVAKAVSISRSALMNAYIEEGLNRAGIATTQEDLDMAQQMKNDNIRKLAERKAEKGLK